VLHGDTHSNAGLLLLTGDIVELKRPGLGFWQTENDHDNYLPHPDLVAAIIQAQNYQFALEGEIDSIKTRERLKGLSPSLTSFVKL